MDRPSCYWCGGLLCRCLIARAACAAFGWAHLATGKHSCPDGTWALPAFAWRGNRQAEPAGAVR